MVIFGILNYLSKFSPVTAEACEPLQKLTSVKADWDQNRMYQDLYHKPKMIHAWNIIMHLDSYTWKLMHQVFAFEEDYCRYEKAWIVGVMRYQPMQLCAQLFSPAKDYSVLSGTIAIFHGKPVEYYMS